MIPLSLFLFSKPVWKLTKYLSNGHWKKRLCHKNIFEKIKMVI